MEEIMTTRDRGCYYMDMITDMTEDNWEIEWTMARKLRVENHELRIDGKLVVETDSEKEMVAILRGMYIAIKNDIFKV